jgi:hypothetical protein
MHACCDCAHLPDAEFVAASDARGQTQQKSSAQPRTILDRHFRPFWPTHFRPFRTILDRHFRSFWPSHFRPFRDHSRPPFSTVSGPFSTAIFDRFGPFSTAIFDRSGQTILDRFGQTIFQDLFANLNFCCLENMHPCQKT